MSEKNDISKFTGILFELKIGLNKDNAIVIDYGGKPVGKIRDALKAYPYHANGQDQHTVRASCHNPPNDQ